MGALSARGKSRRKVTLVTWCRLQAVHVLGMGTLNRALKCLFDHAYAGEKLPPYDQEDAWRHASVKVRPCAP